MVALHERAEVPAFHGPAGVRARNWGPADWDVAEGAHRTLALTAVALAEAGGEDAPLVLVAVAGTWWRRVDDERALRSTVLDALGLPAERLLVSLSHTHAGPVLCSADADLPGGERGREYLDLLARTAADAAREAVAGLRPAVLEWTTARCALASNRELLLDEGCGAGAELPAEPPAAAVAARCPLVGFNPEAGTPRSPGADVADDLVVVGRLSAVPAPGRADGSDGAGRSEEPEGSDGAR